MNSKNLIKSLFMAAFLFSSLFLNAQDWANLKRYQKENADLKTPVKNENRVVFMGNSITQHWKEKDSVFFQINPYICRGISGQTTPQMLIRFRQDVVELQPKIVVILAGTNDIAGFGRDARTYIYNGAITVHVSKGNDLKLVVRSEGVNASYTAYSEYTVISIEEPVANSPETTTEGFPIYEALERTCQHVLDTQYPIYSEFLGRTDVAFDAFGSMYPSENAQRFAHIQSGMNQRGVTLDNADSPLALNFKKLFAAVKAIYNVGYSFETISGTTRIRIEEYAYFFQNTEALNISDRLNRYDIQSVVMPELVPVDLKSGFDSYEYLSINGRAEPNTTNQRTSIMNTATKFEAISPLRGDTKGINDNLSNPVDQSSGSTDTKGDSAIFIVKTLRDPSHVHDWIPEKGENIAIVNDSSLFKDDLLNRYFTPTRILMRHGNKIKAGMMKFLGSVLTFQTSDKSCSLITSDVGGANVVYENGNLPVSSLPDPIYKPMKHTVNCLFTFADLEAIQANPYGYITFSDTISGYLLSLKKENNQDKAEITIIEKYQP